MPKQFVWILLAVLAAPPELSASGPQAPPPAKQHEAREAKPQRPQDQNQNRWKWWLNPDSRKEIGITDAQSKQIDAIFEATFPAQRAKARQHRELEESVARLLKERTADVATVVQQVEKLENLEAELDATRTVMLYRMNLVLMPDQLEKLEAFRKRLDENRRKSDRR
jgi:Spy/CpxP family protein refolding chaperone